MLEAVAPSCRSPGETHVALESVYKNGMMRPALEGWVRLNRACAGKAQACSACFVGAAVSA